MSARANRIRLKCELTRALFPAEQRDAFTGSTPRAPYGRNWDIEIALFDYNTLLTSIGADFTSLTFELKEAVNEVIDVSGATLLSATVAAVDFHAGLTADQWESDADYHARFSFLDSQTGTLDLTDAVANELTFGWSITAMGTTGRVTVATGLLIVQKDGGTGVGSGVAPTPTYTFSDDDIRAGLASKVNLGENAEGATIILPTSTGRKIILRAVDEGATARLDVTAVP